MKNKTADPKALLLRALGMLPKDFALKEANYYIKKAIYKIEEVEKKRVRRENNQIAAQQVEERKKQMSESGVNDPHLAWQLSTDQAQAALDAIDKLIKQESDKIKSLDNIEKQDNDVQTILG